MNLLPVVLVHGTALNSITFRGVVRRLLARGIPAVALDRVGYDGVPVRGEYSLEMEVEHLLAGARAAFGDAPFHVVGHSLGGLLSLHIARTSPQVAQVTLLDPVAARLLKESDEPLGFADMNETYEAVATAANDEEAIKRFVTRWSGPHAWDRMTPAAREASIALVPRMRMEFAATQTHDRPTDDLLAFAAPILVVTGELTREPPKAVARALVRRRGARVAVLPGAAHLLPISHPEAVVELLCQPLARE